MGRYGDVSDVIAALVVLKVDAAYAGCAYEVSLRDAHIVGVHCKGYLGGAPLVYVQGVKVRISKVEVELVDGVLVLWREAEQTLEDEMEVGVAAGNLAVEGVVYQFSGSGYSGVIVSQGVEAAHHKGVQGDLGDAFAFLESGIGIGVEGYLAHLVNAKDAAHVKVPGVEQGANLHRGAAVKP